MHTRASVRVLQQSERPLGSTETSLAALVKVADYPGEAL